MTLSNALPRRLHHLQQELCWDYQCNINPNANEVCNPLSSESPVSWQTSQQFSYSRARASPAVVFHWAFSSLPPWLRVSSVPQHTEDPATGSLVLTISLPTTQLVFWLGSGALPSHYIHRICTGWMIRFQFTESVSSDAPQGTSLGSSLFSLLKLPLTEMIWRYG